MAQLNPAFRWADIPLDEEMGPQGYRETFLNKQGLKLASYWWPAKNPKAVIVVMHGHGAYLTYQYGRYQGASMHRVYDGSWLERWNNAGYSVCGIDQQGHGRSESIAHVGCYFNQFDDLIDDMEQFIRGEVPRKKDFNGFPLFACGLSMGGCVAVNVCHRLWDSGVVKGAVLLSPMLTLERVSQRLANQLLRPVSYLLNILVPTWALVQGKRNEKFPEMQHAWESDPYTASHPTRVRVAYEYLSITSRTLKSMPSMEFDFIVFHSEEDELCDPDGSKQLFAASKASNKMLSITSHFWHNLTEEEGNHEVQSAAIAWTDNMI
mmetsp:Transcript_17722/g.45394  ORF Transcript_17722/g.45394 Transcript_17722/m.45394 type:complete len:321 (+) Transcript_17722:167-1129(+)|eukprot:jgi/Tetstr1/459609/TSEL_004972.t1